MFITTSNIAFLEKEWYLNLINKNILIYIQNVQTSILINGIHFYVVCKYVLGATFI